MKTRGRYCDVYSNAEGLGANVSARQCRVKAHTCHTHLKSKCTLLHCSVVPAGDWVGRHTQHTPRDWKS